MRRGARSPHEVLGLAPGASAEEIRSARRSLARTHHPDNFSDDAAGARKATREMALINAAVEALLAEVHRLHGSCCYVGVPRLQKLAHTIETGLKQGQPLEDLEPEILELLDETRNVERAWQTLVPSLKADEQLH